MHLFDWFRPRIPCLRRRVLLNLSDGQTAVRGVLFDHRGAWLVLKDAELIQSDTPVPMDGDVVIACDRVLFAQVVS